VETRSVIVASGAGHRHLGLESERRLEKKGVTYCATCDGALPMFRNQPLVVVGGGDSACEEALYLTRFGSVVYLVHRRDTLRASKIMADRVLGHEKIKPIWDTVVTEIMDVKQDKVTGVRLKNVKTNEEQRWSARGSLWRLGMCRTRSCFKGVLDMDEGGLPGSEARYGDEHAWGVCGGGLRGPCVSSGDHGGGDGMRGGD
jgi:thioredoxin reductase (NADPH)